MTAEQLAEALGARRSGRQWVCRCIVHEDRNPSLIIFEGHTAPQVRCLSGCDPADIIAVLRSRGLWHGEGQRSPVDDAKREKARRARKAREAAELREQRRKASWLWSNRQPIAGTIAEMYLREARGITCPLPPTLGFLPPRKAEHRPAMIAAFALADEIEPGVLGQPRNVEAVHLTLLKPDGSGKAEVEKSKIIVGSASLPIVLAPPNDLLGLAITEGIEEALSVHQATGLGAWAAGSASRLPALAAAIPTYVECVTVIVDDDKAGRHHASTLAAALRDRHIEIVLEGL
ncbi:toprim domain-containing protein [Bradyrhizobium sp. UFLA05-153]